MHEEIQRALQAFEAKRWPEVIHECGVLLKDKPRNVRAMRLAASAHKSIGTDADLAIGLELLSSALAIKPTLQVYKEYILLRKHADPGHDLADEYRKALQLDTGCEWAHLGLVSEVSKFGDDDQAAAVVGEALVRLGEEKRSKILYTQAKALYASQKWRSCASVCEDILSKDNSNEMAAFLLTATLQKDPSLKDLHNGGNIAVSHAPKAYVSSLYDGYADHFDEHLEKLQYKTPQLLYDLVHKAFPKMKWKRGLDLGCGTGLSGIAFASRVEEFHGVDLSQKMLDRAASRSVYSGGLWKNDVLQCFDAFEGTLFDLVLSSDVFVYIGDLTKIVNTIAKHLEKGGLFVFSCEALERVSLAAGTSHEDFLLCRTRRFAHSSVYLKRICKDAGLALVAIRKNATLRRQAGLPVRGHLMCFQKE